MNKKFAEINITENDVINKDACIVGASYELTREKYDYISGEFTGRYRLNIQFDYLIDDVIMTLNKWPLFKNSFNCACICTLVRELFNDWVEESNVNATSNNIDYIIITDYGFRASVLFTSDKSLTYKFLVQPPYYSRVRYVVKRDKLTAHYSNIDRPLRGNDIIHMKNDIEEHVRKFFTGAEIEDITVVGINTIDIELETNVEDTETDIFSIGTDDFILTKCRIANPVICFEKMLNIATAVALGSLFDNTYLTYYHVINIKHDYDMSYIEVLHRIENVEKEENLVDDHLDDVYEHTVHIINGTEPFDYKYADVALKYKKGVTACVEEAKNDAMVFLSDHIVRVYQNYSCTSVDFMYCAGYAGEEYRIGVMFKLMPNG